MATDELHPPEHLMVLLKRFNNLPHRAPHIRELVTPQIVLLFCVARNPGCGVLDIARELGLTPPTISVGLRALVNTGWLKREPDPNDRRAVQFFLTPEGRKLVKKMEKHRVEKVQQFLSGLTLEEQEQLLLLIEKAITSFETKWVQTA